MGVKADDIIYFEMKCKFSYKNCETTVKKINNIVDVGILCVSEKGYIMEKHKTIIIDQNEFNQQLLIYIRHKINYIEEIYNLVIKEGVRNDSKIMDFEVS